MLTMGAFKIFLIFCEDPLFAYEDVFLYVSLCDLRRLFSKKNFNQHPSRTS